MSTCSYSDCTNTHMAKGLCKLHYYRKKNSQPMDAERPRYHERQTDLPRDRFGRVVVVVACIDCGFERTIPRCDAHKRLRCIGCASRHRTAQYMAEHKRGHNWKGSKYFSGKIISGWKRGASDRDIAWDITNDALDNLYDEQEGLCAYTGAKLSFNDGDVNKVSLDRINSSLPYTIDNVQLTCAYVNICKQSLSHEDFVAMCHAVADTHDNSLTQ